MEVLPILRGQDGFGGVVIDGLADRLRLLRESTRPLRSMTVTSQLIGLGPDSLRKYERGEREPNIEALCLIADYYHVSTDYLLGRTNY